MPRTLQEDAAALLAKVDQREAERVGGKLSPEDRAMIFQLAAKGHLSQEEIAKAVGCSQPTVSRTLSIMDTRKAARSILESGAARLATTVVETDDAGIALKALGKLDVVRDDRVGGGDEVGPIIVIGFQATGFDGFRAGDAVCVSPMPLFGREPQQLAVLRRLPSGGAHTRYALPDGLTLQDIPSHVKVSDEAMRVLTGEHVSPSPASLAVVPEEGGDVF